MGFSKCLVTIREYVEFYNQEQKGNFDKFKGLKFPVPIDINFDVIEEDYNRFHNHIMAIRKRDFYVKYEHLIDARKSMDNARIFLITNIDPINNEIIKYDSAKHYEWFMDNMGRVDAYLDELERTIANAKAFKTTDLAENIASNSIAWMHVKSYVRMLEECFNFLVIVPIERALKRIINTTAVEIDEKADQVTIKVKDRNLLYYYYFIEAYQGSLILGSLTRAVSSGKALKGIAQTNPVTNIYETPPFDPSHEEVIKTTTDKYAEQFAEPAIFARNEEQDVFQ